MGWLGHPQPMGVAWPPPANGSGRAPPPIPRGGHSRPQRLSAVARDQPSTKGGHPQRVLGCPNDSHPLVFSFSFSFYFFLFFLKKNKYLCFIRFYNFFK
jgi:hypothetical protein